MVVSAEALSEIQASVTQAQDGQLVQAMHKLMNALAKHGLVRTSQLRPDEVGRHPMNRDGFGLSPHDVHALVDGLSEVGWDSRETNPICGEISDHAMALGFNEALATSSRGLLSPVQSTQMRYASLANSHTNAALRCLAHEVAHTETECALVLEGRLSMARAKSHDPQLFKAAQEGMVWRVIAREALEIHGVAQLIQSASNTSGHLQRGEHEWQILLRMKSLIERSTSPPEWSQVRKEICRTKPACIEATPYMYQFLLRFMHKELLGKVEERIKKSVSSKKSLGADFYMALSGNSKDWKVQGLLFRHMLLALAYTSDRVQASDCRRMLSKDFSQKLTAAEEMSTKILKMLKKADVKEKGTDVQEKYETFQDSLVLQALEKVKATPESVACELMDELEELLGTRLSTEFDDHRKTTSSSAPPAGSAGPSAASPLREYDEFGKLKDEAVLVREHGFVQGASIVRKKDKVRATIENVTGSKVKLSLDAEDDGDLTDSFLQPFWMVKRTHVLEEANCEIRPDLQGSENNSVKVPCMYNTVAVSDRDELVVYVPQVNVDDELEALSRIEAAPPAKRFRTKAKD
ncbi:unnamed protein product [Durusdinium trenchii]|uniref:Uncharacterized protein n=1 Tax=Durusdinium trenchii TaxID=1381693 RepID=A0ABP0NN77_9DINO